MCMTHLSPTYEAPPGAAPPQSQAAVEATRLHFPGARSENADWLREEMLAMLDHWFQWRERRFEETVGGAEPIPTAAEHERLSDRLAALRDALTDEIPTYTPRYIAHMKADLSLPAILGWFAAMLHNPNNTSQESSRVGSVIETEALMQLADMLGYDRAQAQGHFTSGGTVANFEAMWRARYRLDHWLAMALHVSEATGVRLDPFEAAHMGWDQFRALWREHRLTDESLRASSAMASNPAEIYHRISKASGFAYKGPIVLVPGNRHYSWNKAVNILGLGDEALWSVRLDRRGRLDIDDFDQLVRRARSEHRPILMSVAVVGSTELGVIDPIDQLFDRMDQWRETYGWHIWRHVDAAYGGFLTGMLGGETEAALTSDVLRALRAISISDSVTIDPHKLGYIPYACGAFLTPDRQNYVVSAFDAPYLDRPELGPGKWSSTIEGSRSAAGAAATWLTAESMGFGPEGLGAVLAETIEARRALEREVVAAVPMARFLPADCNIACFSLARDGEPLSVSNARTLAVFDRFQASPAFAVSKTVLGADAERMTTAHLRAYGGQADSTELLVIRCVVMNPYWCDPAVRAQMIDLFIDELGGALEALPLETPESLAG